MILYDEFVKLVTNKEYGKLKRAWFTSFTISPDFIERYILPPLFGLENDLPKTPSQFETINALLGQDEDKVRFFFDAKMPIEGFKRTTVKLQGVFHESGLFHPKVTLIEFERCSFLIVGSANLTLSGWGRNREAVAIKEIGVRQANQVKAFFKQFRVNIVAPKATKPAKTWNLIYENLPKELICEEKYLYVWSPYFSSKLESLSKEQFSNYEVNIIPDTIDGKIRLAKVPDADNLSFYRDVYNKKEMTHAKVWLTPEKIAIGSHNFTGEALKGNNLEASIVDDVDKDTFNELTNNLQLLKSLDGMTDEELKEDALPEHYNEVVAHLKADWKARTINIYFIKGEERKLNEYLPWKLYLPGDVEFKQEEKINGNCYNYLIELTLKQQEKCFNALLTDRMFYIETVIDSQPKTIASGYIEEIEASLVYRSPHTYTKLHDFFLDSLTEINPESSNRTYLAQDGDSELHIEGDIVQLRSFGYFEIFEIFNKIKQRLLNIKDRTILKHAVCYLPNSLRALKKLLEDEIELSSATPSIYNWFIIYEFNSLLEQLSIEELWVNPIKDRKIKLSKQDKKFISSILDLEEGTI